MKAKYLILSAFILVCQFAFAQSYEININVPEQKIDSSRLKMGGTNRFGSKVSVNSYYMSINGQPVIPVSGEFHYARYPKQYWEESIRKMKAGGINMIATYVFWNIHEEKEGVFDWSGDKDLRAFIQLCAKNKTQAIVRIGPFCHGEIRNGALPDWLLGKPFSIRSNDSGYLAYVERLYNKIGEQLKGLLFKDGGPVIAIQIENEYQHSAAPWGLTYPDQPYDWTSAGRDKFLIQEGVGVSKQTNPYAAMGNSHMKVLKALAIKAGMDVPVYTVTGWGNAAVIDDESLPVTGAYPYPTWVPKKSLSPSYLYRDLHLIPENAPVRYKPQDYPVFCAELGGGIMVTYKRRPVVPAVSMDAIANRFVGSGSNGIGYYMYHGGSSPKGKEYFFSDEAYGYNKISYDFQAPIGEYGQLHPSFNRLKLLHFFLDEYGKILAPMQTILPAGFDTILPNNLSTLRYAMRAKNGSGFLFLNNFQDHASMKDKENISLKIKTNNAEIRIPENGSFTLKADENAIFPVNILLEGVHFNYATAQLLTTVGTDKNKSIVFFSPEGVQPEFSIDADKTVLKNIFNSTIERNEKRWLIKAGNKMAEFEITLANGHIIKILIVDKPTALHAWPVMINHVKHLVFSNALIMDHDNNWNVYSKGENTIFLSIYPSTNALPVSVSGKLVKENNKFDKSITNYKLELPAVNVNHAVKKINDQKMQIDIKGNLPASLNDIFMQVEYTADNGMAFINSELVADDFYKGDLWEIGLKRFLKPANKEMILYFRPIYPDIPYLSDLEIEALPDFSKAKYFTDIRKISFIPEYKAELNWNNK